MAVDAHSLHQGFVTEGRFIAFPLSIPDETLPLPPDESYLTALVETDNALRVYGATEGAACHLFVASHRAAGGGIVDLGVLAGVERVVSLMVQECGDHRDRLIAAAGTEQGFELYRMQAAFPRDTIQEPTFPPAEVESVFRCHEAQLVDAALAGDDECVCLTDVGLLHVRLSSGEARWLQRWQQPQLPSRLAPLDEDLCWIDGQGRLCVFDVGHQTIINRPLGVASASVTALCPAPGGFVCATDDGRLRLVSGARAEVRDLGTVFLPFVQCLAALPDGRIYGVCGDGIGYFFRASMDGDRIVDLGAIASVIVSKRYGFEFACAVAGRQGDIYLAEHDRGGHLWLYLPPLAY